MSILRKAAQDVVAGWFENRSVQEPIDALAEALQAEPENPDGAVLMDAITAAFQRGFAEASSNCQGILDSSPPSVDALIAEIDARPRYCGQSDAAIDAILEKYRSKP